MLNLIYRLTGKRVHLPKRSSWNISNVRLPNASGILNQSIHVRKDTGCLDLLDSAFMRMTTHPSFWFEFVSVISPERGWSIGCSQTNVDRSSLAYDNFIEFPPSLFIFYGELQRNNSVLHSPSKKFRTTSPKKKRSIRTASEPRLQGQIEVMLLGK